MKFLLSPIPTRSRWPIKQVFFLFYWDNKYLCVPSDTGSIKRKEITSAIYFANTSKKLFCSKRVAENGVTTMLHYYYKTIPGTAWLHSPKFYLLGIMGSYPFRNTAGLLIPQYFTYQWNQVSLFANFLPFDSD